MIHFQVQAKDKHISLIRKEVKFGFRTVELIEEPVKDSAGSE